MRVAVIVCLAVCFLATVTAFVVLTFAGKDTTAFVMFVGGAAASLVPSMLTLLKTHQTQNDVAIIKDQTNGPLTELRTQVDEINNHVSGNEGT